MRPSATPRADRPGRTRGGTAGRRPPRVAARIALAILAAALGLTLLLATGCGSDQTDRAGATINLTFPAGTTRLLESGGSSKAIPEKISGRVGDTLVVRNNDSSTQFIAGYSVSPGQTLNIPLNRAGSYITNCSAHKDRSIRMEIAE